MCFKYLICLDFEATCWEVPNPDQAEIIEIGALLWNHISMAVESEFHCYVRPTMNPILSDYCVNLTGISQSLIDQQSPFPFVYQEFIDWLNKIGIDKRLRYATPSIREDTDRYNTTFCTWSNWNSPDHLGHYFRIDCERSDLRWPLIFRTWIDARKIFKKLHSADMNFADALKLINLKQVGRAHSAIDGAKSLVKMVKNLCDRGVEFDRLTDWR